MSKVSKLPPAKGSQSADQGSQKGKGGATNLRALQAGPKGMRGAAELRERRAQRLKRTAMFWVGLPTALAALYYCVVATPQYESVTSFTVQSSDNQSANIAGLLGGLTGASGSNVLLVRDFIESRDMLAVLANERDIVEHYGSKKIDLLSRLKEHPTAEEAFDYYLGQIEVFHDTESNVLTLKARAFDAESAHAMAATILKASESKVNRLSEQAQRDAIQFAEKEVERAQARLADARQKIMELQGEGEQFNPLATAQSLQTIVTQLEAQLAKERAKLRAARSTYGPAAPEVRELRQHVASLRREIDNQKKRLVDTSGDSGVSDSIARYEPLAFEKEFAERALQSALTSMEMARVDAARQHRYLAVIAAPSKPDAPTHPDKLLGVVRVFVLSVVLAGLGGLILASIREHARF